MRFPTPTLLLGVALLALASQNTDGAPLRVLYFSKSAGWEHDVVKRTNGQPSFSDRVLTRLGAQHDMAITCSKDGSLFSPEYLERFDVIMFYTTGDLFSAGVDGQPPMTPAGKQALLDAIAGGKGFVAVHSGSDTFHTGEKGGGNNPIPESRYQNYCELADPFIRMVGGEFLKHGAQQPGRLQVVDPHFPGMGGLPESLVIHEEWYSLKEFAADLHVTLVLDTAGMRGSDYQRAPYPVAWARIQGKGRVWFNAMGHREDVWESPVFQAMLLGGIEWAAGRAKADTPPNLTAAAPSANVLPKYVPGFD
jgi:type 1 glutamine amidotransferase